MEQIPGETRVRIEHLLTYITDMTCIAAYLQVPREWVLHVKALVAARPGRGLSAGGIAGGGNSPSVQYKGPTPNEKDNDKRSERGCASLLRRHLAVYARYSDKTGLDVHHCAVLLMNCVEPNSAIARSQKGVHTAPRKEAP